MSTARFSFRSCVTTLGLVVLSALTCAACQQRSTAVCGTLPSEPMVGVVVTTTTGEDGTNANIHLCVTRKSTGSEECLSLDNLEDDDFEAHEVNVFKRTFSTPIAVNDFGGFEIKNVGGGFLDNSWGMVGLRLEGVLQGGRTVLLYEESMDSESMDPGDSYDSSQCSY